MPDVLPGSLDARALREYANRPDGADVPGEWFIEAAEERKRLEQEASSLDRKEGKLNAAGRELVQAHMHLARKIVDEYDSNSPHRYDLLQEAYKALCIAADTFDPDRGRTFGAYARAVVRRKVNALKTKLRSSVSLGPEVIRFQWKHKQAERAFIRESGRRPLSVELVPDLARVAAEELRPVWLDRWPADRPVSERLEALAQGLTLETDVEDWDKALTCINVLLAGLAGGEYSIRLDGDTELGGDYETPGESVSRYELVSDSGALSKGEIVNSTNTQEDAILEDIDQEEQGRPSREQEARDLYRAKKQALWQICNLPLLLSSRQRFLMMLRLGADGRGSRSLDEATEIMSRVNGEPIRRDSVARTLNRAVQDIREYVETSGAGPSGVYNPWHNAEEDDSPWHRLALAEDNPFQEAVAQANREHVLNGGDSGRWFNPYSDDPPWISGQGRISNPYPADPWQDAIRLAMQSEDQGHEDHDWLKTERGDLDWPDGTAESFEPDTRTGRDLVTGGRCQSAPDRPVGPSRHRIEWRRIQALSRPRLGKRACQYGRLE